MRVVVRYFPILVLMLLLTSSAIAAPVSNGLSPDLHEMAGWGSHARTAKVTLVLLQLGAILIAAKLAGRLAERLKVPGVIGELLAGVVLGPYLLGEMIRVPLGAGHVVPLFPAPTSAGEWPINDVVWTIGQVASVVLLFSTGLHTELREFLRHAKSATLVALAGVVLPMALGTAVVVLIPPFARLAVARPDESPIVPALFVGAILAATSIGITARVLGDLKKLHTAEGVTILGAAVLDDVLGIIALAIVGGIATTGAVSATGVLAVAAKAFGFWIGLTAVVFLLAGVFERFVHGLNYTGATVGLSLALALISSGLAESAGLAFIIGAYSAGLGLSRTQLAKKLLESLQPVEAFLVPVFFVSLGMLVNVHAMFASWPVVAFGIVVTVAAVVGKLLGCGGAARLAGFSPHRAYRVGVGMLPRGEVALIVAGVGLSSGIVGEVVFGVSILMTLLTTVLAPILLVRAFDAEERLDEVLNVPPAE